MNNLSAGQIVAIIVLILCLVLTFRKFKKRAGIRRNINNDITDKILENISELEGETDTSRPKKRFLPSTTPASSWLFQVHSGFCVSPRTSRTR